MKLIKNQQGYALLVVLLIVVLFLGLSATFVAGSLSHAKQEQTIDASNQAVASAEMGVKYYSTDFQREIGIIKSGIIEKTQNEIKTLVNCFNAGGITCNTQAKLTNLEKQIDTKMKKEYIEKVRTKVNSLVGVEHNPFSSEKAKYKVTNSKIIEKNAGGDDITQNPPLYNDIRSLEIKLTLTGESSESTKELKAIFTVEVPLTFLSAKNKLTVETVKKTTDMVYTDIFVDTWPTTTTCQSIKNTIVAGGTPSTYQCVMGSTEIVKEFADFLKSKNLNPVNFTVYAPNFGANVCESKANCNAPTTGGLTVVFKNGDSSSIGNMNKMTNANLIIDGPLIVDQFQNPGTSGKPQTIIVREITVNKNMHGQGLENTNLVILGNKIITDPPSSTMSFSNKITIGDYGRVCFDMDRIKRSDWENFRDEVEFKNDNTTGQIIYYTKNLEANKFILPATNSLTAAERTKLYVQGYDNYTNFLSSCGANVSKMVNEITDVPVPYVIDPGFDIEVEY